MAFKMDLAIITFFQVISPLVMLFVWTAIYLSSGVSTINHFTLSQIITYFFIVAIIYAITPDISWGVLGDVRNGNVFAILTRPLSYVWTLIIGSFANIAFDTLAFALPIMIILIFAAHISLPIITWLLFIVSMLIMLVITLMFEFMMGYLAFFMIEISGLISIYGFVSGFLGGSLVPLNLLPQSISSITSVLPFQFMLYTPAAIFTGAIDAQQAVGSIEFGILWAVVLLGLDFVIWYAAKRHVDAVGV
ncbi:MAG: ABC-2 family transporter protein [Candidatus Micrarchaeota archaeon]|nr:ABC-2 family transporter protein [Candidatus Micrarchaeota archaeon]